MKWELFPFILFSHRVCPRNYSFFKYLAQLPGKNIRAWCLLCKKNFNGYSLLNSYRIIPVCYFFLSLLLNYGFLGIFLFHVIFQIYLHKLLISIFFKISVAFISSYPCLFVPSLSSSWSILPKVCHFYKFFKIVNFWLSDSFCDVLYFLFSYFPYHYSFLFTLLGFILLFFF